MSTNRTQSKFIRLVYTVPIVIGNVLIFIIFITIREILYKVILSKLQLVKAKLVIKRTIIGQVSYII